jgi:succinate dehydrogenase / fumarate reductase, iron-sulfur subunit
MINVRIFRYDPAVDAQGSYESFEVPALSRWTVMDSLDYITKNLDSSVAYYRHSACDHGICGRCLMKINGKLQFACSCEVGDAPLMTIEPAGSEIVRDLVVRQGVAK